MRYISVLLLTVLASPALAASGPFFSLHNTDFVVTVAFIGFVALVLYLGVPKMLGKILDALKSLFSNRFKITFFNQTNLMRITKSIVDYAVVSIKSSY